MTKSITVGELKEQLEKFNDDTVVLTNGYEGGFDSVSVPTETSDYKLNVEANKKSYYGDHAKVDGMMDGLKGNDEDKEVVEGICL